MHNYSIDSNERVTIIFFIALLSIGIMYIIQLGVENFPWYLEAPSPFLIFTILFWLFDKHVWKVFSKIEIIKTPNLNGKYTGFLKSSHDNYESKVDVLLVVKQNWTKVLVTQETVTSKSVSVTGAILTDTVAEPVLVYSYKSNPINSTSPTTMSKHDGTCEHIFDKNKGTFDASYYSGRGRNTVGDIFLKKNL